MGDDGRDGRMRRIASAPRGADAPAAREVVDLWVDGVLDASGRDRLLSAARSAGAPTYLDDLLDRCDDPDVAALADPCRDHVPSDEVLAWRAAAAGCGTDAPDVLGMARPHRAKEDRAALLAEAQCALARWSPNDPGAAAALARAALTFAALASGARRGSRGRDDDVLSCAACLAVLGRDAEALAFFEAEGVADRLPPDLLVVAGTLCPSLAAQCLPRVRDAAHAAHLRVMVSTSGLPDAHAFAASTLAVLHGVGTFAQALAWGAHCAFEARVARDRGLTGPLPAGIIP